jgi:formylglycine-generating enzyme required for sulfatase activity
LQALIRGDWEKGLPYLAKGSDAALRELAGRDLAAAAGEDPQERLAVADGWWKLVEKEKGAIRAQFAARAHHYYEAALPSVSGIEKTRVENQLRKSAEAAEGEAAPLVAKGRKLPDRLSLPLAAGVELNMRLIPAGEFLQGSGNRQRRVTITKPLYLGQTEVTQSQWRAILGSVPGNADRNGDLPADSVSWEDCQRLVGELNRSRLARQLTFRLPTEAEWEYACRAGTTTAYHFGDRPEDGTFWYRGNTRFRPQAVARAPANAWGLHDMHGNVWEWCSDWYGEYTEGAQSDPAGAAQGTERVVRGGGYFNSSDGCTSYYRHRGDPRAARRGFGVRLAAAVK